MRAEAPTNTPTTPAATPEAPVTTPAATPEAPAEEDSSFTDLDLSALPPELQGLAKSLQGDYTRKRQAEAALVKEYTQFGTAAEIQAAVELQQAIQDPSSWTQLHTELTAAMREAGLTPAEAQAAATEALAPEAAETALPPLDLSDPELAPLAQHVQALQARLDAQEAAVSEEREFARAEQEQMALVSEMQRQENAIRQTNPTYTDTDLDAVYELSSFYNGNLLQAQQRYEQVINDRFARYLEQKKSVPSGAGSPAANGASSETGPILDSEAAHKAGLAALREYEAVETS